MNKKKWITDADIDKWWKELDDQSYYTADGTEKNYSQMFDECIAFYMSQGYHGYTYRGDEPKIENEYIEDDNCLHVETRPDIVSPESPEIITIPRKERKLDFATNYDDYVKPTYIEMLRKYQKVWLGEELHEEDECLWGYKGDLERFSRHLPKESLMYE